MKKFFLFAVCFLAGCQLFKTPDVKPTKKPGQDSPLITAAGVTDNATTKADNATNVVNTKTQERDSKVLSNVLHAKDKNQENPDGAPKTIVDGDLEVAASHLSDVKPDPAETAARERDAKLVETGKATEARANYANAAQSAQKLTEQLTTARLQAASAITERDAARAAETKARDDFNAQLETNRKTNQKVLDDLNSQHTKELEAERNKMFHAITYALIACSVVCILIGAFSAYSKVQLGDILRAVTVAAVWAGAAGFCIACAWTINQPWFKWVLIGGCALGLVGMVLFIWSEYQSGKKGKARIKEADEAEDALKKVMNTLDSALPKDDPLFQKLATKLSDNHKALINELKAEEQRVASVV